MKGTVLTMMAYTVIQRFIMYSYPVNVQFILLYSHDLSSTLAL